MIATSERFVGLGECECGRSHIGYPGEAADHRKWHVLFERGLILPKSIKATDGDILVVPANELTPAARVAYKMARVAQRAGGYDFPTFPYPSPAMSFSEDGWMAYLPVIGGCAVGYACVVRVKKWSAWASDADGFEEISRGEGEPRPVVTLIFICKAWRRQGLATRLVRRVAEDARIEPGQVLWGPPFTQNGLALAKNFRDDGLLLIG